MSQAGSLSSGGGGGGSSGALVLIQTQTATNQTTLDFTTGINGTYNTYFLLSNAVNDPTTGGTILVCRLSTDGGATFISTGYQGGYTGLEISFVDGPTTQISFFAYLFNMTSGAGLVTSDFVAYRSGIGGANNLDDYTTPGIVVNAIEIAADDATPFSGKFSLYGIMQ